MEHLVLSCLESRSEGNGSIYGRFLLGPLKVGQGTTVATALRRTLLSELQGIAITAVEIKGATHQYSSIAGVQESTLDIVLNLKQIVLAGDIRNGLPAVGYLAVQGPKTARARDLKLPNGIRCVDENQHIASVSANGVLTMKFVISAGKNYVSPHSPSAQTLTPSLFQPKMREGGITPLALRAVHPKAMQGQPLHRLVQMVGRNSPLDTKHGQPRLTRGGKPPRLSGSIGAIVVSNAARRLACPAPANELVPPLSLSAFATRTEAAGANRPAVSPGTKRLTPPLPAPEDSRTEAGINQATGNLLPLPLRPGTISELSQSPQPESQICSTERRTRPTERRIPVRPVRPAKPDRASQSDARGGIFSVGSQQASLSGPDNSREAEELMDGVGRPCIAKQCNLANEGGRFAEMALNGPQSSRAMFTHHQALKGLAQRGKQWETDSSPLPIDAVFMPVNKVNFSLQIDDQWQEPRERVILEIWTNGSIHPRQAISEAASYLVYLFSLLRQADAWPAAAPHLLPRLRRPGSGTTDQQGHRSLKTVEDRSQEGEASNGGTNPHGTTLKDDSLRTLAGSRRDRSTEIGDLGLSIQAYVALKRAGVNTIGDLMSSSIDSIGGGGIDHPALSLEIEGLIKRLALD